MIKSIKIHSATDAGTLVTALCYCGPEQNYLVFDRTGIPFINAVENTEKSDFICPKCNDLLLSAGTLETAHKAYKVGLDLGYPDMMLNKFFRLYGIENAQVSEPIPLSSSLAISKKDSVILQKLKEYYQVAKKKAKLAQRVFVESVKESLSKPSKRD